jgi:hypothetical protein
VADDSRAYLHEHGGGIESSGNLVFVRIDAPDDDDDDAEADDTDADGVVVVTVAVVTMMKMLKRMMLFVT